MRTLTEIKLELDRATARRSELWTKPGHERDGAAAAELARLNRRIPELWEELRIVRTRVRFGSPDLIVRRAEVDKRLERELERRIAARPKAA